MAKQEDAGLGLITAARLGAAEDIREHATHGILTGTFASGVFPVGHGGLTSTFVHSQDDAAAAAPQLPVASADIWLG